MLNAYVGESEKAIQKLFKKAKLSEPCIIFFDEIDGLVSNKTLQDDSSGNNNVVYLTLNMTQEEEEEAWVKEYWHSY